MKDELKDLTGMRFGRLTVLERAEDYIEPKSKKKHVQWLCQCDCGSKPKIILGNNLKKGATKSCGCFSKEVASLTHKQKNYYENIENNITKVFFNNVDEFFICDTNEWENLKDITWIKDANGYVYGIIKDSHVRLHRFIMNVNNKEYEVDHIDGNPLNNLKSNLRICIKEENAMNQKISTKNTSGHVGVYWDSSRNKWCAILNANKKRIYIGRFDDFNEAVIAREQAEEKYMGEFSPKKSRNGYTPRTLKEIMEENL